MDCSLSGSSIYGIPQASWLLTVCGGGLEPRPGSFLDDCKWHQSLRTMEDHISARATHLQKEPQDLPEMVKV